LKKSQSVRSSIIMQSHKQSYGKIMTDYLDRNKSKAEQLRNELEENNEVCDLANKKSDRMSFS